LFAISVETHFQARHSLSLSDGSKEPAHSHNWSVCAELSSGRLNKLGLVMDFNRLKKALDKIVGQFDNASLEQFDYFQQNNPSAEMVAKYIYEELLTKLPENVTLKAVTVGEKEGWAAKYCE